METFPRERRAFCVATIFLCVSEEWRRIENPFICTSSHDHFVFTFSTRGISTLDAPVWMSSVTYIYMWKDRYSISPCYTRHACERYTPGHVVIVIPLIGLSRRITCRIPLLLPDLHRDPRCKWNFPLMKSLYRDDRERKRKNRSLVRVYGVRNATIVAINSDLRVEETSCSRLLPNWSTASRS